MTVVAHPDPTFARMMEGMLIVATIVGTWLALFTRNALTTLDRFGQTRVMRLLTWGFPQVRLNPDNRFVFWFYRIDGAVVAIGGMYTLLTGRYPH